ncbi:hypothetical protein F4802DRAFT_555500 [Xylaria palmicola]|nr:hypothetical protein F4802DRAFT_555500 [Xylaria palmicola]
MIASYVCISLILPRLAWANTEKTIFLGPSPAGVDPTHPTLDSLRLIRPLNPHQPAIRTHLEVAPHQSSYGKASWFVLHNLTEGRRYEVRVCWAATQPTAFRLEPYELKTVLKAPELTSELSSYASTLQSNMDNHAVIPLQILKLAIEDSVLLLRVIAAADFYTTNSTLMKSPPPVFVDIILDPFLLNILPRSLVSTVTYILVVAIVSWWVGRRISSWIRQIAAEPPKQKYQ